MCETTRTTTITITTTTTNFEGIIPNIREYFWVTAELWIHYKHCTVGSNIPNPTYSNNSNSIHCSIQEITCNTSLVLGVHVSSPKYFKLMYAVNFKLRMAYFKIDVRTELILIQNSTHKYSTIQFWQEVSCTVYLSK